MKVKALLLDGNEANLVEIHSEMSKGIKDTHEILGISELQGYHSFGRGYCALWQYEREENTSMEITVQAGASYPIFIDSKVLITCEDSVGFIDVNLKELKKHFNTENAFWALIKNN